MKQMITFDQLSPLILLFRHRWYKDETIGWHSLQSCSPNWPSLFVQIGVFDLALAESIAIAASRPVAALSKVLKYEGSYTEKVESTLANAATLGYNTYDGEHGCMCCVCADGGDLCCCELCPNVAHTRCYGMDSPPDKFICNACISDFEEIGSGR